jgi:tRNA-specific 2-thiouridylase
MTYKAVTLISGGLDSLLAAKVIQDLCIHVEGHMHAIRKKGKDKVKRNNALSVAEQFGIELHIVDIVEEYKGVVINPKHGNGANLNPCLDCKIFMVQKAHE